MANHHHDNALPVLRARPSQLADRALVVGDPDRAAGAAALLSGAAEVGRYREYLTFTGNWKGRPVTICSHGVGGAGASVAFHELIQAGVMSFIRAGTCGGLQTSVEDGSFIIATGAIREDGTSPHLAPLPYPAIADFQIVTALRDAAAAHGYPNPATGVVFTQSFLYPELIPSGADLWMQAGAVAVEMELATLLVMAGINGRRAGGIFVSDGNIARRLADPEADRVYNPHREVVHKGIATMLAVALDALASLD